MMSKKVFCIPIIVLAYYLTIYPQAPWEKIKTPTDFNLLKVSYLDSLHCWVAGDSGVIMFSSDQGDSWEIQNSGVSNYIEDIFFLNKDLGWAVSYDYEGINIRSKILKTSNGGLNWQNENYRQLNVILTTICFIDSLTGWIGGEPFELSYTKDGGSNWSPAVIDTGSFANLPINKLRFSSPQYGFAVGGFIDNAGVVWRTSNSGQLWKAYGIAPDIFDDFLFIDSINTLALSADRERFYPIGILKFNINNNALSYTELDDYGRVTSIAKRTPTEIWGTLACDTSFIFSIDGGSNWRFLSTKDSLCYFAAAFTDSLHGIIAGEGGYILKYVPENPVSVENADSYTPFDFVLEQNYPNPFNPSTKIRWQSPISGLNSLKIYDVLGNEIAVLVDDYKSAGSYEVEFNVVQTSSVAAHPSITSGIYFYRLRIGSFVETKKMLLLK
jgi:photosystem II stability/assembly factor-like uncharacterized protein